ncbi:MAG: uL15 family ribosomal protein [Clostridia bacterium]|nr:uL15 family ribosomal protein [Clostridia bacterium]
MNTTIIVIIAAVVALALLGVILFFILRRKKKAGEVNLPAEKELPKTVKEETVEEKAAPAPQPVAEAADTQEPNTNREESDDEVTKVMPVVENGKTRFIVVKYSKSFLAKLIQSDDQTKAYYSQIKNKLLSYEGVKSRISWKGETFRKGRKALAKLRLRGKTLSLALALNPNDYEGTKYRVESIAEIKAYAATPCLYRIKNDRRIAYAKELIAELAAQDGVPQNAKAVDTDYAVQYPYEETDALIGRGFIKVLSDKDVQSGSAFPQSKVRESVTVQEADALMKDEVAASLIEKSEGTVDRTKQGIINIDTLSQCFESGETVTLDEIKKRVKGFHKQTTYLKVLARGKLDKPLTVEADSFSIQAVKMIVLTGGKAIKNS